MNFLAHFHLAWPEAGLVAGGLEGDFHKGVLPGTLPTQLQAGVSLHRAIDAYTDNHPVVASLREQFPPGLRRYAGILIDLCFDHCLARQWDVYCEVSRPAFAQEVYQILRNHSELMSDKAALMATRLQQYDVLNRYQEWDTIVGTAQRIGQRLTRANPLAETDRLMRPLLPELERGFAVFYPDLLRFSRRNGMLGIQP